MTKEEMAEFAPGIREEEMIHPVMCVLPMGWAHSPLIAQEAREGLLSRTSILQAKRSAKRQSSMGEKAEGAFQLH